MMKNWNSKDIAEMIGIIALVASLIFVGIEINQNSAIARREAHSQFIANVSETLKDLSLNKELSSLLSNTLLNPEFDPSQLSAGEITQILSFYYALTYNWYGLFLAVEEDILDEKYLETIAAGGMYDSDIFRAIWPRMRGVYSPEFVEFFESLSWNTEN
jgi:hypothetical protein